MSHFQLSCFDCLEESCNINKFEYVIFTTVLMQAPHLTKVIQKVVTLNMFSLNFNLMLEVFE